MRPLPALVVLATLFSLTLAHLQPESRAAILHRRYLVATHDLLENPAQLEVARSYRSLLQAPTSPAADPEYDDAADREATYEGYYEDGVRTDPKVVNPTPGATTALLASVSFVLWKRVQTQRLAVWLTQIYTFF
jgi:hypothetical protein